MTQAVAEYATITVTTEDGGYTATSTVAIKSAESETKPKSGCGGVIGVISTLGCAVLVRKKRQR